MRRPAILLLAAACAAALLTPVPGAAAAPPGCQTDIPVVGDVDGDGLADLVVGLPGWDAGTGAVELRLTRAPGVLLTETAAGVTEPERGDAFGTAVAVADLDGDGCDEVVVGAPGTLDGAGRVHVLRGSPTGVQPAGRLVLDGGATPGDRFGSALAVTEGLGDGSTLWVGSPSDSPGAVARAGSLTQFTVRGTGAGLDSSTVATLSQATPGVPGTSEPDDHFGAVLAPSLDAVLVGVPDEDVGSARDAGAVTLLALRDDEDAGFDAATSWNQSSAGIAGTPEPGDHFGAAVSALFGHVVVGVPGEDVGRAADAGMVQTWRQDPDLDFPVPTGAVTQNSPGIPGTAETGDRFGAAVLVGRNVGCGEGVTQAVVGVPGEDLRSGGRQRVGAGTVLVAPLTIALACPPRADDQSNRLAGSAEAGDRLGSALGLGRVRDDHDDETGDHVFVGVPGEDRGAVADAGIVVSTAVSDRPDRFTILVAGRRVPSVGSLGGAVAGQRYGSVLATPTA